MSRSEEVQAALAAAIVGGEWRVGQRLPSERELTARYKASRVTVREALAALRSRGMIASRRGSGAYVTATAPASGGVALDAATHAEILDCLELRRAVEVEAAGLAALRASPAQLSRIEAAVGEMATLASKEQATVGADWRFHLAVAEATNNAYFARIMAAFGPDAIPRGKLARPPEDGTRAAHEAVLLAEHRRIAAALANHDAPAATEAMRAHMANAMARYERLPIRGRRAA